MKSIRDTLEIIRDITNALPVKVSIALTGGYAAILHGVERTTIDLDFCLYADVLDSTGTKSFYELLKKHIPDRFTAELREGSKLPDDPFKHDLIRIMDTRKELLVIDLLIARYKWELDALLDAKIVKDVPFPVLGKPYLAAMKLRATGYKDAHDFVTLFKLMTAEEQEKTRELAIRIGRDKKLERLLNPPPEEEIRENPEEYL